MPRQIQVLVPFSKASEVHARLELNVHVHSLAMFTGAEHALLMFKCTDKGSEFALHVLDGLGVGVSYGTIDILELAATKPRLKTTEVNKKKYSARDRLPLEEIYEEIDSENHLTFNYIAFVIVAAMIAAVGLATNSAAVVVASMLVSPLMGPILGVTFGASMLERTLVVKGLRNEFVGILLCCVVGFVWGISTANIDTFWYTEESVSRGNLAAVWAGVALAIPSGVGVALATTGGGASALVGVAISAALLPPIVNSAMYFGLACRTVLEEETQKAVVLASFSFALFFINFLLIFLVAVLVFKLKNVGPERLLHGGSDWIDPMFARPYGPMPPTPSERAPILPHSTSSRYSSVASTSGELRVGNSGAGARRMTEDGEDAEFETRRWLTASASERWDPRSVTPDRHAQHLVSRSRAQSEESVTSTQLQDAESHLGSGGSMNFPTTRGGSINRGAEAVVVSPTTEVTSEHEA